MAQHQFLDDEDIVSLRRVKREPKKRSVSEGFSFFGLVGFAVAAAVVTVSLLGNTNQTSAVAAYFLNGNTLTLGHHSLDLSRPIYLRSNMPICPGTDQLDSYSPGNPNGCVLTDSTVAAELVAIITDGMKQPSFEMQVGKGPQAVRGWVDYSNLTN